MLGILYILLLFVCWVVIAVLCHIYIKNYYLSSFLAACAIVIATQIASYIELGHIDPLWVISSVTGLFMGGLLALIVGLPFKLMRSANRTDI